MTETDRGKELRARAEAAVEAGPDRPSVPSEWDADRLHHELSVYMVELEAQNDELRRAHGELAEVRDRYQELYDLAPVGYLTLDRGGRITEANRLAVELLGGDRARVEGRALASFMEQPQADELHLALRDALDAGEKRARELELTPAAGRAPVAVRLHVAPISEPFGWRCVLVDLSEVSASRARSREAEERLRQIAEYVDEVFVIFDRPSRRIVYASPAYERVMDRSLEDAYGGPPIAFDRIDPRDRESVQRAYEAVLAGDRLDLEFRIVRRDGEVRWIHARSYPIAGPDGVVERDAGLLRDVTKERRLEDELRQAQKMEAVGALASGVAHDFNNLLQGILGCLKIARDPKTAPERAQALLDHATSAAQRGGELAARLMTFSRKRESDPVAVAVDDVITGLGPLIERLLTEQISLTVETGSRGARVRADPVQIEQILLNLAANARDAMPRGGSLVIRTGTVDAADHPGGGGQLRAAPLYLVVEVEDTGAGMDEATRERVFEPFFTTKEPGKGTGLGLSTIFAVTEQLGGSVRVDSAEGRGTKFTILLPCSPQRASSPPSPIARNARFDGRTLLVEDDDLVRMSVSHYLEGLGFEVVEASDAEDARAVMAPGAQLDLLVTDVVLPSARGPKLAAQLRDRVPGLPVVYMTANTELVGAEERGADPVLRKPFGREELTRAIAGAFGHVTGGDSSSGTPVVLLVEDEPASRLALGELLREQGHEVLVAGRPSEAMALAQRHGGTLDVLLTDQNLPEMTGTELAEALRVARPGLRVAVMSGQDEAPAGVDAFVRKPIDLDRVLETVDGLLTDR